MPAPVGGGRPRRLERVDLHEVEVVEQADPHDARHDVQPAAEAVNDEVAHVSLPSSIWRPHVQHRGQHEPAITVPQSESSGFFIVPPYVVRARGRHAVSPRPPDLSLPRRELQPTIKEAS